MLERLKSWLLPATPPQPDAAPPVEPESPAPQRTSSASPDVLVIDVRSEREFQTTALEHAVNVPLPQLQQRIGELVPDRATALVLYCASGARSGMACKVLKQMGYSSVTNAGGLYAAAEHLQFEVRR